MRRLSESGADNSGGRFGWLGRLEVSTSHAGDDDQLDQRLRPDGVDPAQPGRPERHHFPLRQCLPVSRQSQYDEKYTSLSTRGNYYFAPRKWLRYTFGVGIDGHMSRYQTTPNDEGSGGRVLPKYGYLATQAGRISFKYWNIGYSYSFRQTYYYQLDDESSNPPNQNLPDQDKQLTLNHLYRQAR